jgi:hypothetical protein
MMPINSRNKVYNVDDDVAGITLPVRPYQRLIFALNVFLPWNADAILQGLSTLVHKSDFSAQPEPLFVTDSTHKHNRV